MDTGKANWATTKGVSSIHNIIRIEIFRHYEQSIDTYELVMLTYRDMEETKLLVLEVIEPQAIPNSIAISPIFKNWTIETVLFRGEKQCVVALVKIDNELILMSKEEFDRLLV